MADRFLPPRASDERLVVDLEEIARLLHLIHGGVTCACLLLAGILTVLILRLFGVGG